MSTSGSDDDLRPRSSDGGLAVSRLEAEPPVPAFLERIRTAPARVVRAGGSRERTSAPTALAAVCPFLAGPDGEYRAASPARDHRCGAVDPPQRLPAEQQQQLCLRTRHFECPAFVAATAPGVALTSSRPVPRSAPLILERAEPVLSLAGLNLPARAIQLSLAGLLVVAVAIVVLGGGGRSPAAAIGPSASAKASAVAQASTAPGKTPRPTAAGGGASGTREPVSTQPTETSEPIASTEPDPSDDATAPPSTGASAKPTASPNGSVASGRTYKVKKGDTLSGIAAKYGTTVKVLTELNNIKDPRLLRVGQILKLP